MSWKALKLGSVRLAVSLGLLVCVVVGPCPVAATEDTVGATQEAARMRDLSDRVAALKAEWENGAVDIEGLKSRLNEIAARIAALKSRSTMDKALPSKSSATAAPTTTKLSSAKIPPADEATEQRAFAKKLDNTLNTHRPTVAPGDAVKAGSPRAAAYLRTLENALAKAAPLLETASDKLDASVRDLPVFPDTR
ncbi:MAG: hypothetical protein ACT4OU_08100 [Hyphomicrobium sp.]